MAPKSGHRFSDKAMRKQEGVASEKLVPDAIRDGHRFSDQGHAQCKTGRPKAAPSCNLVAWSAYCCGASAALVFGGKAGFCFTPRSRSIASCSALSSF